MNATSIRGMLLLKAGPVATASCLALLALLQPGLAEEDAGKPWRETFYSEDEVREVYGTAEEALSLGEARDYLLSLVNEARRMGGLRQVAPDALANELALKHAESMAKSGFVSHYSLEGLKCEARFNRLGGTDQVEENAAYYEIEYPVALTPKLVARLHQHLLRSDSHAKNILDPAHTNIGSAIVIHQVERDGGVLTRIAAVQEFTNDYAEFGPLPEQIEPGGKLRLSGAIDPQRARPIFIGLGSEDLPSPRTPEYQMMHITGYSPPAPVLAFVESVQRIEKVPKSAKYIRPGLVYDAQSGSVSLDLPIGVEWPEAAYYVSLWAADPQGKIPGVFCVMTQVVQVARGFKPLRAPD